MMPPNIDRILDNLALAENLEQRHFIKNLRQSYPESIELRLQEIRLLMEGNYASQAATLCLETLELPKVKADLRFELHLRFARLEASSRAGLFSVVQEEFINLWQLTTHPVQKNRLLRIVSGVHDVNFINTLEELAKESLFSEEIVQFFHTRVKEIRLVNDAVHKI